MDVCPSTLPFYNDTRFAPGPADSPCMRACTQLGDSTRTAVSPVAPFRCTTFAQASRDGAPEDEGLSRVAVVAIAAAVFAVLLLIVACVVLRRRRGSAQVQAKTQASQPPPAVYSNPSYEPNTRYGKGNVYAL